MHCMSNKTGKCKKYEERKVKDMCAPWKASSIVELELHSFLQQVGRVVGLTPRPLYLQVRNLWHALDGG